MDEQRKAIFGEHHEDLLNRFREIQATTKIIEKEGKAFTLALRQRAKSALKLPPPSKPVLREVLKKLTPEERTECLDFDLGHYLTGNNCLDEIKSLLTTLKPRSSDLAHLWFTAIAFEIEYVAAEIAKSKFDMDSECERDDLGYSFSALGGIVANYKLSEEEQLSSLQFVLELGVDVNSGDNEMGRTALMLAIKFFRQPVVDLLLARGANPDIIDNNGKTILMYACEICDITAFEFWFQKCVDVDVQDDDGNTAVMHCCFESDGSYEKEWDREEILELLFQKNANINIQNCSGNTALMISCMSCHEQNLPEAFVALGIDASNDGAVAVVKTLLQNNPNVDLQDNNGETALMKASKGGSQVVVKMLLNHGVNKELKNDKGKTAVAVAKTKEIKAMIRDHVDTSFVLK